MTKQTDEQIYTTRGKSFMAKVHEPETSKLFPSAGPMFQTSVLYPSEDDEEFKKIRALIKQYKAPMRPAEHKDSDGNETGEMRVTFSRRAFKDENDKVQNYPIIVDKYGDPLPKDKLIGNGSDIIVSFKVREYTNKVTGKTQNTLTFTGVQVANLIPYIPKSRSETNVFKPLAEKPDDLTDDTNETQDNLDNVEF